MAGLTRLSGSGRGSLPMFPSGDKSSVTPYYNYDNNESAYVHLPAFTGGTSAGGSIRILQNSTNSFSARLYDKDGGQLTSGVWNGDMSVAEASGTEADGDRFVSCYMDETDNLFYMWLLDYGTDPDTYILSTVNEAGTVNRIGAAQGIAGINGLWYGNDATGPMYRVGGDGSGNFAISAAGLQGGSSAAGVPYRGTTITINASDASLSYSSGLMPSAYGALTYLRSPIFGPTGNGIIGGAISALSYTQGPPLVTGPYGSLGNTTTGRFATNIYFGSPATNGYPTGLSSLIIYRARRKYIFSVYGNALNGAPAVYDEEEVHAWLDNLAVYYGIL